MCTWRRGLNSDRKPIAEMLNFPSARKMLLKCTKNSDTHLSRDMLHQRCSVVGEEWVGASHNRFPCSPGPPSQTEKLQRPDLTSSNLLFPVSKEILRNISGSNLLLTICDSPDKGVQPPLLTSASHQCDPPSSGSPRQPHCASKTSIPVKRLITSMCP